MNKTIYIAPAAEQIKVRFEENIMSVKSVSAASLQINSSDILGGEEGEDW